MKDFTRKITSLSDHTGTGGYGACIGSNCTNLENLKAGNIVIKPSLNLQSSGVPKTYTYEIRYGIPVNNTQTPGIYSISNFYNIWIIYQGILRNLSISSPPPGQNFHQTLQSSQLKN